MSDEACSKLYWFEWSQRWVHCQHDKGHDGECGYEDRTPY